MSDSISVERLWSKKKKKEKRKAVVDVMSPALLQRRGAAEVSAAEGVGVGSLGDGRGVLFPFRVKADQGCEPVKTDTKQSTSAQSVRASITGF